MITQQLFDHKVEELKTYNEQAKKLEIALIQTQGIIQYIQSELNNLREQLKCSSEIPSAESKVNL